MMTIIKKYYYILTGILVFIIYLFTLAPSVVQIDSGELATVQAMLGIAHPTGYPLFTMVGHLFSLIPLPFTKIFQLNLLAALSTSAGVSVFVYTSKLILDNFEHFSKRHQSKKRAKKLSKKDKKLKRKNAEEKDVTKSFGLNESIKYAAAILGGLIVAFSETYWAQSTSVEVYSLHILLINLILLFLIKAFLFENNSSNKELKGWLIFSFILALGFTNHMTTLLILPGVAYLYFSKNKFSSASLKKIAIMFAVFFPVLILIYLYLPLRASQNPLLNWGNPIDLERIIRHISGKQYQVWLFASTDAAKKQLVHFVETLPSQFYFSLIFALLGIYFSFVKARKLFIFLIITFLFTVLYSINYEIHDIDSYFLLAYISLGYFSVLGIIKLFFALSKKQNALLLIVGIAGASIVFQSYLNFNKATQDDVYIFEDYTKAILNSVPRGSIVFSYQWDYFVAGSYYFRYVENFRNDVTVVDKELLRRSWYFDQLSNNYPYLFEKMQDDVNRFKEALKPFERSEQFNPQLLESLYRKLMTDMVATNINERDFYIAPELVENEMQKGVFVLPKGLFLIPDLLLFKVVKTNEYLPAKDPDFQLRLPGQRNYYINMIETFAGSMLARRAMYELKFGKVERAKIYVNKIINDLPDYPLPPSLRSVIKN